MILRPVDNNGDMLPVLSSLALWDGVKAEALIIKDRLNLFTGEWWENASWGNDVIEIIRESRITEENAQLVASYLCSYICETPGVVDVQDVVYSVAGRVLLFKCTVNTESGSFDIDFTV